MTDEEHRAHVAKFRDPLKSEHAHEQLTKFWAGCTGEARARKCAHLTNPEAQAKSHAAQRTPEFKLRKSAWSKAAWARLPPDKLAAKKKAVAEALTAARKAAAERRRAEREAARLAIRDSL